MEDHKSPEFPLHIKTSCVRRRLLLTPVAKSFLKMIMNLSERTADAAIYILSGELPLESFIHSQNTFEVVFHY
jgi:hypothetical protein